MIHVLEVSDKWDIEMGFGELTVRIMGDSLDINPLREKIELVINKYIADHKGD